MVRALFALPLCLLAALAVVSAALSVADAAPPAPAEIDIFDAIKQGQIETELIPKNSTGCQLILTNKTDRPLSVRLPAVVSAAPVLGQFNFSQNNSARNPQASPQTLGVPTNNTQATQNRPFNLANPNRRNVLGPLFSIPPEKVIKVKFQAVCLEHGHPTPRPQMKYELRELATVTTVDGVAEVCDALGRGEVTQAVAQLAAWHLNNNIGWRQFAAEKEAFTQQPRHSTGEIKAARKLAEQAVALARARKNADAPSSGDVADNRGQ